MLYYFLFMEFTECIENEVISYNEWEPQLRSRLAEINELLESKLKTIKTAPKGTLRVSKSNNVVQYYHKTDSTKENGLYIPKKNLQLIKALAQKDYDITLIQHLKKEAEAIKAALKTYHAFLSRFGSAEKLILKTNENRRGFIKPIWRTDEDFVRLWQSVQYKGRSFVDGTPEHFTTKGERVRSKSEVLIADTLNRLHIPYRYEYPIKLKTENGERHLFYPDFLCLNPRTRKEFLWEHFGLMDDPEYSAVAANKLALFTRNGIFAGKNLIITMETAGKPINSKQISKIAEQYLS